MLINRAYKFYCNYLKKLFPYLVFTLSLVLLEYIFLIIVSIHFVYIPDKYSIYSGYLLLDSDYYKKLDILNNYISEKESENYTVFFLSPNATLYRWPLGINKNKQDLFVHGNVGKHGYEDTIKQIENSKKPLIICNISPLTYQEFEELKEYLKENYKVIDIINGHYIYIKK